MGTNDTNGTNEQCSAVEAEVIVKDGKLEHYWNMNVNVGNW